MLIRNERDWLIKVQTIEKSNDFLRFTSLGFALWNYWLR
jgi:hypothetical protein